MPFESELVVTDHSEMLWVLQEDLVYRGNYDTFVVPEGFPTDFASVPRVLWSLIPTYGRYTKAAVLHDYLCKQAEGDGLSRCDADGLFRKVMRELGVGYVRRRMMWAAVRWAGGIGACGWRDLLAVLLITVLALPLLIPAMVVFVFLVMLWLVEMLAHGVRKALGAEARERPTLLPR